MQIPSNVWQEMNILALLFCVKFPDLSAMLCFQSMKLENGAKKGFCFTSCSVKPLTFMQSEKIVKHVAILCRLKWFPFPYYQNGPVLSQQVRLEFA